MLPCVGVFGKELGPCNTLGSVTLQVNIGEKQVNLAGNVTMGRAAEAIIRGSE